MRTSSEADAVTDDAGSVGPESVPGADAIGRLQAQLRAFATERGWERYHTPRNLAALIASEAGELLAHFRWEEDAIEIHPTEIRRELADVFLGVLRFADVAGIDLESAACEKLLINERNYPISQATPPNRPNGPDPEET